MSFLTSSSWRSRNDVSCCAIPLLLLVLVSQSISSDFQDLQRKQSAFDAGRRDLDPELAEHIVLVDLLRLLERQSLQPLGQQRRRCLRDRAATPVESDVLDHAVADTEVHPDHVAAQRVVLLVADVGVLEAPVVSRVLVVVEDVLAIELVVSCCHQAKILCASLMEVTSRSISSFWV